MSKNAEYVNLNESNVYRRRILETAVDATQVLKFAENHSKLKSKKTAQITKLRTIMRKITKEVNALKAVLPEMIEHPEIEPKKKATTRRTAKKVLTKKESELDQDIKEIKEKLSKLGV